MNIYGHVRATQDIDLLAPADAVVAILDTAATLGFTSRAGPIPFASGTPAHRELYRATKIVDADLLTVDVLVATPVLQQAWQERGTVAWRGHRIPTVSRSGLIAMKRLAGRLQDLADIERLEGRPDE